MRHDDTATVPKGKIEMQVEELLAKGWTPEDAEDFAYLKKLQSWTALSEPEAARVKLIEDKYKTTSAAT